MKTFKLNEKGDVVIKNNRIEMVEGIELTKQTIKQVINTNLGEWFSDKDEGIDYHVILVKNPNYELIKDTINTAVQKVADIQGMDIETDNFNFEVSGRNLTVTFDFTINEKESASLAVTL